MSKFEDLKLIAPLLRAVKLEGYEEPTPIQEKAIPHVLDGCDILGCAQTGTGKTAAFALPILQRLCARSPQPGRRPIRALTLTPTRELAMQIGESFSAYGRNTGLRCAVIFGGVNQGPQTSALRRGVDILVATPGRLLDLTYQGLIDFYALEIFVLDEADRMMDMGFINDVKKIVGLLPEKRQTLFFSATMPNEIRKLSDSILNNPVSVAVTPPATTVDLIDQSVYFVEKDDKLSLLADLMQSPDFSRVLIFTRTKHGADKVARRLERSRIPSDAIHGNKTQSARQHALDQFKRGRIRALVATDIASRGIDVDNVSHVINFDVPNEPESYVHRIGRTGRAGATGQAISFCDSTERAYLATIERLTKKWIRHEEDNPYKSRIPAPAPTDLDPKKRHDGPRKYDANQQRGRKPGGGGYHGSTRSSRSGGGYNGGGSGNSGGGNSGNGNYNRRKPAYS